MTQAPSRKHDIPSLDALTGGAFTAPTSGERVARIRDWLQTSPSPEQVQDVFKELSGRDKGAARLLRERLDEDKRAKGQEAAAAEWGAKGEQLVALAKLNIADAMAWQRDAARAGAPLSREPLASLKTRLADRVKRIEDLQHRAQVQRESAVLLSQRFDVLSTKSWKDAQSGADTLNGDVTHWGSQVTELEADSDWSSIDARLAPQIDAARNQLASVSEAFSEALALAATAAQNVEAPLPSVPVWADELRRARGETVAAARPAAKPAAPKMAPEVKAAAQAAVEAALGKLEQETAEGHGKASAGAAAALRSVLKEHGKAVDAPLEARVHSALVAAGELEGWQRWSADKVREDLVARAEGLLKRPDGQALGGRKMQESLRTLRDQWKKSDQGGVPNHALWRRFDEACTEAHKVVEAWLEKVRADAANHRAARMALIEEVQAWANEHARPSDLKAHHRALHQFADRWREAGYVGEKMLAELQPKWDEAFGAARAPFESAQDESLQRRQAMIGEATELGAAPQLRIDAVKALQQRWQAEAQAVPLDRRQEQKMWDAFRAPIDDAFNRKTAEREQVTAATSQVDRYVLDASRALDQANASGDAQRIRAAIARLEAASRGEAPVKPPARENEVATSHLNTSEAATKEPFELAAELEFSEGATHEPSPDEAAQAPIAETPDPSDGDLVAPANTADAAASGDARSRAEDAAQDGTDTDATSASAEPSADPPASAPKPAAPKRVVAMRGDDRPGMRKSEPATGGFKGRGGDRRDARGGPGAGRPGDRGGRPGGDRGDRYEDRGPRLGDAAFRAQRNAIEHAQAALRKLAAQAHGEALSQTLEAWAQRDATALPNAQALGRSVGAPARSAWSQALQATPEGQANEALLRLEMAAQLPTPAEHIEARRALQLQLLTRRNDPSPGQTWTEDAARVLGTAHEAGTARRLQSALKVLLKDQT